MKKIEGIEEYYASRNIWRKAIYLNDLREIERMIGFEMVDLKGDFGKRDVGSCQRKRESRNNQNFGKSGDERITAGIPCPRRFFV